MLKRAEDYAIRQLDLVELLHRQRMILLAVLAMLPQHSVEVITNLSTLPIHESSNLEYSSGDEMVQAVRMQKVEDLDKFVNKTFDSKSKLDQRLAGLIRRGKIDREFPEMKQSE